MVCWVRAHSPFALVVALTLAACASSDVPGELAISTGPDAARPDDVTETPPGQPTETDPEALGPEKPIVLGPPEDAGVDPGPVTVEPDGGPDAASEEPVDDGLPCDVAELLSQHCTTCHDGSGLKAPMALGTRGDLLRALPGAPARTVAEEALARMRSSSAPMPPGAQLAAAQIDVLASWLESDAPDGECTTQQEPSEPFAAVSLPSALGKVKTLLSGLPVSSEELAAVANDPARLRELVDTWIDSPEARAKRLEFFKVAFQQTDLTAGSLFDQVGARLRADGLTMSRLLDNLEESFARTTADIVEARRPFTEVLTTTRFELTPALISYLLFLDQRHINDAGRVASLQVPFDVRTEGEPIDYAESIDPQSPNYMVFTAIGSTAGCASTLRRSRGGIDLFSFLLGRTPPVGGCNTSASPPLLRDEDFTAFRSVSLSRRLTDPDRPRYFDLPLVRSTTAMSLSVARRGFFSTPAFFGNWSTNDSNQMRVTANQTLIVALSGAFDGTDTTLPLTQDGLTADHGEPGTACYACHKTLDPMRMFFKQAFTLSYHDQRNATLVNQRASFSFAGERTEGVGIEALAEALAAHPRFARAWTQKLCWYANSQACSESDPEFERVAQAFVDSGFDFKVLLGELFSSPLVTRLAATATTLQSGAKVSIARRNHFCYALSVRLGISDACGLGVMAERARRQTGLVAESIPKDSYSRGTEIPVTPSDTNLFTRAAAESVCSSVALLAVRNASDSPLSVTQVSRTLSELRSVIMGLPDADPRALPAQTILTNHYNSARAQGVSTVDALRSAFVLACTAPSSIAVGL